MIVRHVKTENGIPLVAFDGKETFVTPLTGETPEKAAARWAQDAFGVALTPAEPTVTDLLIPLVQAIANDPNLAPGTKKALADMATLFAEDAN